MLIESGRRGSNPRPSAWKANALSTELLPQNSLNFTALSGCTRHNQKQVFASALVGTTIPRFRRINLHCFVGKDGFEPPKAYASRFTVCPIWPLWYLPKPLCITLMGVLRLQSYNYFCKLQAKLIIFIAVSAHSLPLLPNLPPALSSACSILSVVNTPKMTGMSPSALRCAMPCVTPWQT